ncbi:MAG: hypothetical protein LAN62_02140 [Acidobacteriia bacterium]|nr:hypothetical protein [Terriglobia bacterium]
MAAPTIAEENSISQSARHEGLPVELATLPQFESLRRDSWTLATGFIDYLATASDEGLSTFTLQHLGEASECALALKKELSDIIDSIIDQREAERAAVTQTARDGHFRQQKVLTRQMISHIFELIELRIQHLTLERLADVVRQLPTRSPRLPKATGTVSRKPTETLTEKPEATSSEIAEKQTKELVDRRVTELLADPNDYAFGGWFRERARSNEIRRHQSRDDRMLWSRYFDAWGCVSCGAKDAQFGGCGFCDRCYSRIGKRIEAIRKAHNGT